MFLLIFIRGIRKHIETHRNHLQNLFQNLSGNHRGRKQWLVSRNHVAPSRKSWCLHCHDRVWCNNLFIFMDTFHFRADVEFSILIVGCHHSALWVRTGMIWKTGGNIPKTKRIKHWSKVNAFIVKVFLGASFARVFQYSSYTLSCFWVKHLPLTSGLCWERVSTYFEKWSKKLSQCFLHQCILFKITHNLSLDRSLC